jgi:hypothetical protein
MEFVGVTDTFGGSGNPTELMNAFGLTAREVYNSVKKVLKRRAGEWDQVQAMTEVGFDGEHPQGYPKPGTVFPLEALIEADKETA